MHCLSKATAMFPSKGSRAPSFKSPPKPVLATLCLARWHCDPMLSQTLNSKLWESRIASLNTLSADLGFKNITNHLKVLVQCGSVIKAFLCPFTGLGHCKNSGIHTKVIVTTSLQAKYLGLQKLKSTARLSVQLQYYLKYYSESISLNIQCTSPPLYTLPSTETPFFFFWLISSKL